MLRPFLLLFLIIAAMNGYAQGISNDTTHRYLIILSKTGRQSSHIIKESARIRLYDQQGKYHQGKLYFINDSIVQIHNISTLRTDTLNVKDIHKIRIAKPSYALKGYLGILAGSITMAIGINYFFYKSQDTNPALNAVAGLGIMGVSVGVLKRSGALMSGKWMREQKYRFISYTSKNASLKRKDLKVLFSRP